MTQPDLFAPSAYPAAPGARRRYTSRAAAEAIAPRATSLRDQVLALLMDYPLTADQCAYKLGVTVLACRPRLSELVKMGKITDTGDTNPNESGVRATVWRAA